MPLSSVFYTVFLCMIFGANAVAMKLSFMGVGPYTAAGLRFLIAGIAIYTWARLTGKSMKLKRGHLLPVCVISAIFIVQLSLFYVGLNYTTASRGTLISNLLPFFIMILAHFFIPGDRINIRKISGILVGFSGIVFLFYNAHDVPGDYLRGDLLIFCAVTLWSSNAVIMKTFMAKIRPYVLTFYPMLFGTPVFLTLGFYYDHPMIFNLDTRVILALLYQALVTAAFGFVAWNTLLKKYGATSLHTFVFIMPVAGVFFSALLLDEKITGNILVSLLLITTGIICVNLRFNRNNQRSNREIS